MDQLIKQYYQQKTFLIYPIQNKIIPIFIFSLIKLILLFNCGNNCFSLKIDQQLIEENIDIHSNFLDYIDHSPDFFYLLKLQLL